MSNLGRCIHAWCQLHNDARFTSASSHTRFPKHTCMFISAFTLRVVYALSNNIARPATTQFYFLLFMQKGRHEHDSPRVIMSQFHHFENDIGGIMITQCYWVCKYTIKFWRKTTHSLWGDQKHTFHCAMCKYYTGNSVIPFWRAGWWQNCFNLFNTPCQLLTLTETKVAQWHMRRVRNKLYAHWQEESC